MGGDGDKGGADGASKGAVWSLCGIFVDGGGFEGGFCFFWGGVMQPPIINIYLYVCLIVYRKKQLS